MSESDPPRFIAWTRTPPSKTWVRVAEGTTEQEARERLLAVPFEGKLRDTFIGREGTDPNGRRFRL